ncbi:bifunctional 4-hydroxy-2-oxoglutarate aldolase/2-dehydro-3-deoxy-phosphogluconate aldolase [Vibrio sp. S4M6]|uniref:bifunctional 4-hydroxy-2-oxoglutarate aldolase/2-dehydro-3-deoxy-phosphogluconate aldolase n=1 Tax=Vibrio sinus TaxID=2946865 RepID=UPI00202A7FF3|nr:bifunctional 4-hydroxy-2-oxoglutarate aldolase/2-dehydro-3-deoxy-phosphogluconate aldolase [Vibrio sinus]MCL9780294.1 bifunctional 4-hydroxy-2-oxoglutarate aldolase/2-dehydro-3-deoxy-phosphogluconate aldolase [Vibrio sinus]
MNSLEQQLQQIKVVPVIAIEDAANAVKLAQLLIENGLPCAEITFRTKQAAQAIANMRKAYPDMLIGAGTVLNAKQVDAAVNAGADFIVSPGFNPTTVKYCQQHNIKIVPGVNNPSLVEQAMEMGLKTLKFFPAEASGGIAMLKALISVYPVKFMPTGGIAPSNVKQYLAADSVVACGGSWMVPSDLINQKRWDELAALIKEVVSIAA